MVAHGPRGAICCPRVTVPAVRRRKLAWLEGGVIASAASQGIPLDHPASMGHALGAGHGTDAPPAGCDSPRSNARTSDSRNLRCPPGVRMLLIRPEAAHRVTVFGSTRKSAATSPGVRRRSLLPSTDLPSHLRFGACLQCRENIRLLPCFPQNGPLVLVVSFRQTRPAFVGRGTGEGPANPVGGARRHRHVAGGSRGVRRLIAECTRALFHHAM